MKKLFTSALVLALSLAAALAASAQTTQTIRRVSLTATGTNIYATFAAAQSAAANNDIIQMEPGTHSDITLTKPLVVVGPGYFLDFYTGTAALQANTTPATVNIIYFNPGSSGSSVSGLTVGTVYMGANDVTLQRCNVTTRVHLNYNGVVGSVAVNNVNIRQNYINFLQQYTAGGVFAATNILVTNNIIVGAIDLQYGTSGEFRNNVQADVSNYPAALYNFNVVNNYFGYFSAPTFTNCTVTYNAFRFASAPTTGNNQNNVVQTNVFPYAPGATQYDAWFQLKAGTNSLRGAGENGVDIGAFAGNAPYRLGGLPAIPSIYQLSNSVSGNTLNVNLSTRSNN